MKNLDKIKSLPLDISKEEYELVKQSYRLNDGAFEDWYIGAIGFLASYNGKFFGGYSCEVKTKDGVRYYYQESVRNLLKQAPLLKNIEFQAMNYRQIDMTKFKNGVIYCDIPYESTTGYQKYFSHDEFWKWAEENSKDNIVLVSEQSAPDNWIPLWEKSVKRTLDNKTRKEATEKLFVLKS